MAFNILDQTHNEFINHTRERVNKELTSFFEQTISEMKDPSIKHIVEQISEFTIRGGKRIRPILIVCGHDLFAKPNPEIYKAAISIELTQTFFLIHDNIMDQSDLRRGYPSFHKMSEKDFERMREPRRMGETIGIVAGDLSMTYAYESLMRASFPANLLNRAISQLISITKTTGYGEGLDMLTTAGLKLRMNDLIRLHLWKTAKYTIEGPLLLGASLSGYSGSVNALRAYGNLAGLAFQLHDDIIGLYGTEEEIGKSPKSDLNEGKQTLLIIKALERCSKDERKVLTEILEKGSVTDDELQVARDIVRDTGSLQYSKHLIGCFVERAKEYIMKVDGDRDVKIFLHWLADYLVKRTY